jgi:hypothetical protein
LRHYASDLTRSWRNAPASAFIDALIQIEVPLAVAVVGPLALLGRTVVPALTHPAFGDLSNGVLIASAITIAVVWVVDRELKTYEFMPGIEPGYNSARDRKLVYVYYAGGFLVFAAMLFAAYLINRAVPVTS